MAFDTHIGVKPADLERTIGVLRSQKDVVAVYEDGDGWNCWGEAPGTDVNDPDTLHVIARTATLGQGIDLALRITDEDGVYGLALVPSNSHEHGGRDHYRENRSLACVTKAEDWAEQFFYISTATKKTLETDL